MIQSPPSPPELRHSQPPADRPGLRTSGHWPTLLGAFLYFDFSFMVWTVLGPLSAHIKDALALSDSRTGLMVAVPSLAGAALRITLGLLVDRIGAKNTGLLAQGIVIAGLAWAWPVGLHSFPAVLLMGFVLGFAGASFAVALPQAGRCRCQPSQAVNGGARDADWVYVQTTIKF